MKIIETLPREIGFVLLNHCQNLLDDPRMFNKLEILCLHLEFISTEIFGATVRSVINVCLFIVLTTIM